MGTKIEVREEVESGTEFHAFSAFESLGHTATVAHTIYITRCKSLLPFFCSKENLSDRFDGS